MAHLYPLDQPDDIYPKDAKIDFRIATTDDINNPSFFQTLYDVYKFGFPDDARNPKFFHDVMNLQQQEKTATGENRNCYDLVCAIVNFEGKTDLVGVAASSRFMAPRGGWSHDSITGFSRHGLPLRTSEGAQKGRRGKIRRIRCRTCA